MLKICQDMDGVIFDLMSGFIDIFNKERNEHKTLNDVNQWAFYEDWGMTHDECFEIFDRIDQRKLKLLDPHVPEYLKILNKRFQLDIVTLKPIENEQIIREALVLNGIKKGIQYNELIIKSYDIPDIKSKLDYDIYIDDSEKLAKTISQIPHKRLLLYDSPWNKSIECNSHVTRVNSWKDIMEVMLNDY